MGACVAECGWGGARQGCAPRRLRGSHALSADDIRCTRIETKKAQSAYGGRRDGRRPRSGRRRRCTACCRRAPAPGTGIARMRRLALTTGVPAGASGCPRPPITPRPLRWESLRPLPESLATLRGVYRGRCQDHDFRATLALHRRIAGQRRPPQRAARAQTLARPPAPRQGRATGCGAIESHRFRPVMREGPRDPLPACIPCLEWRNEGLPP